MKTITLNRTWGTMVRTFGVGCAFAVSTAGAAIVWDLNPNDQHAPVGSSTQVFTSNGFDITARGYVNNGGEGTSAELFFKNRPPSEGASEVGLGLVNSAHNELNANTAGPLEFIQLDLRSILAQGATNGQIAVASLQNGEGFQLFGSDFQGVLGIAIGGPFTGLAFDDQFVAIPSFGTFDFISIVAATSGSHVLPSRFAADITPIPEVGTVIPIVALLVAVGATSLWRRRSSTVAA